MRKLKHQEIPRLHPSEVGRFQRHPIRIVLDNVRSLYNVGSIFRTSDAAFIEHIYLTGITGTPEHSAVHKTALGSQDTVPWSYEPDPLPVLQRLKQEGFTIAALEITDTPTYIPNLLVEAFPLGLIVGHEVFGVSESALAMADLALELPQYGTKQSLNVSVAYGAVVLGLVERYRILAGLTGFDLPRVLTPDRP